MKIGLDASVLVAWVKKIGEKYHEDALELSIRITSDGHHGMSSALLLIELPGALASSTTMPIEKIYDVEASVMEKFRLGIKPYEPYVDRAVEFMLEFRSLKTKWEIGSADFHYLATSHQEGCDFFVTTDEKHLLRAECKEAFSKYIRILAPDEAASSLE